MGLKVPRYDSCFRRAIEKNESYFSSEPLDDFMREWNEYTARKVKK